MPDNAIKAGKHYRPFLLPLAIVEAGLFSLIFPAKRTEKHLRQLPQQLQQLAQQMQQLPLLLVGFLVFVFSVLFPLSKLVLSVCLAISPELKSNKVVYFLVHKTGKWSMADVMVVAIFMSYIGFSGILTEQLHQLENLSSRLEILTTNKLSLQIGFFAFTSFALLSLLLTNKLKDIST